MFDPCRSYLTAPPRRWRSAPALALFVGEPEAVYRPRHPERFERTSGPLRPVVPRTVEAYLDRGRLFGGFARLRCPQCRIFSFWGEYLLAFSCHPPPPRLRRGMDPQFLPQLPGQARGAVRGKAGGRDPARVPHRHVVFTIPRALRGLFERERKLPGLLPRCAFGAVRLLYQEHFARLDALPGMVASIRTFGSALNYHRSRAR